MVGLVYMDGKNTPLQSIEIFASIMLNHASVKLVLSFLNKKPSSIEAIYKFPLPENSIVHGFKIIRGNESQNKTEVYGNIAEKESAFDDYDETDESDIPYILEQNEPNIYTLKIKELIPNIEIAVEISLVYPLEINDSTVRFFMPLSVYPRRFSEDYINYLNNNAQEENFNPKYAISVPYRVSLKLDIPKKISELSAIISKTHKISVINAEEKTVIFLDSEKPDRDIIIDIGLNDLPEEKAYIFKDGSKDDYYAAVLVNCECSKIENENEFIFLIDNFALNYNLEEIKTALSIILRALKENSYFNIYKISSEKNKLFRSSQKYSETTLEYALDYIREININEDINFHKYYNNEHDIFIGAAEKASIIKALREIAKTKPEKNYRRKIFIVSDSLEADNREFYQIVSKINADVFILGISFGLNDAFLKMPYYAGKGDFEIATNDSDIAKSAFILYNKAISGRTKNIKISLEGFDVEQYPESVFVSGKEYKFIYSKITGKSKSKTASNAVPYYLQIDYKSEDFENSFQMNICKIDYDITKILWAGYKIKELERMIFLKDEDDISAEKIKKEIIDISKEYGIMSLFADFAAAIREPYNTKSSKLSALEVVEIPVMTRYQNTGERLIFANIAGAILKSELQEKIEIYADGKFFKDNGDSFQEITNLSGFLPAKERLKIKIKNKIKSFKDFLQRKKITNKENILLSLLNSQSFTGGFIISPAILSILGINFIDLNLNFKKFFKQSVIDEKRITLKSFKPILYTALIIAILEIHFESESSIISPLLKKSYAYLDEYIAKLNLKDGEDKILNWAKNYVNKIKK